MPAAPIDLGRSSVAPDACAAVYLSWSTGPAIGCVADTQPRRADFTFEIRRAPRMGPDAPVWAPVGCPARREPGARQPEQYAQIMVAAKSGDRPETTRAGRCGSPCASTTDRRRRFSAFLSSSTRTGIGGIRQSWSSPCCPRAAGTSGAVDRIATQRGQAGWPAAFGAPVVTNRLQ
ncbi:hypothetical protein I553_0757 [Mycobacterium xenopi 4042]|uniref:Uncharacterized protein n=1 Tax=Mycobacterium xenopi 4042 TaxID=1299334 RepID=X7YIU4_MYCXE|nr:hypothetical protein I553_0757 [Mycobacterium xenopi 4042]